MSPGEAIQTIRRICAECAVGKFEQDERRELEEALSDLAFAARKQAFLAEIVADLRLHMDTLGAQRGLRQRHGGHHQTLIWIENDLSRLESNLSE